MRLCYVDSLLICRNLRLYRRSLSRGGEACMETVSLLYGEKEIICYSCVFRK